MTRRVGAFATVLCLLWMVSCGRGVPSPDSKPTDPENLDEALGRVVGDRTLAAILADADAGRRRSILDAVIAMRTVAGDAGGRFLSEACQSRVVDDRKTALSLLTADLDAAKSARRLLARWLGSDAPRPFRYEVAALVLELDSLDSVAVDTLRAGLGDQDDELVERAVLAACSNHASTAAFGDDLLRIVESGRAPYLSQYILSALSRSSDTQFDNWADRMRDLLGKLPAHDLEAAFRFIASRGDEARRLADEVLRSIDRSWAALEREARVTAVQCLVGLDPEGVETKILLMRLLDSDDEKLVELAETALGRDR